jgi:hypothetical protein
MTATRRARTTTRKSRAARSRPQRGRRTTLRASRGASERATRDSAQRASAAAEAPDTLATSSPTAIAAEAERTGIVPGVARFEEPPIPGREGETMQIGDPDVSSLSNEYSGEEAPGSSTPTPDQSLVDDIGRAYGVQEGDSGPLRASSEVLDRRDRRRED